MAAASETIVKQLGEPTDNFERRPCWDIVCYYDQDNNLILWVRYFQSIGTAVTAYTSVKKQQIDYNFWVALHPRLKQSVSFKKTIYADQVVPLLGFSKDETACFLTPDADANVPSEIETDGLLGLRVLRFPVYRARWDIFRLWEQITDGCKTCDDDFASIERAFSMYENGLAFTPEADYWRPSLMGRFVLRAYEASRDYFRATCELRPRWELWRSANSDPLKPTDPDDVRPLKYVPNDHVEIEDISDGLRDRLADLEDRMISEIEMAKKIISEEIQKKN